MMTSSIFTINKVKNKLQNKATLAIFIFCLCVLKITELGEILLYACLRSTVKSIIRDKSIGFSIVYINIQDFLMLRSFINVMR